MRVIFGVIAVAALAWIGYLAVHATRALVNKARERRDMVADEEARRTTLMRAAALQRIEALVDALDEYVPDLPATVAIGLADIRRVARVGITAATTKEIDRP